MNYQMPSSLKPIIESGSLATNVQILDPESYEKWDNEILSLRDCSFFHSIAWSKVLSNSYHYTPCYFVSYNKDKLSSIVPMMDIKSTITGRRGVSLPFTDYCEPLISESTNFQDIFNQIIKHGINQNWKYIELRGGENHLPDAIPSSSFLGHCINLSKKENEIYKLLKNTFKRNIKKAKASGVSVNFYFTIEAIKEFYRLNCLTRKRHGLPPQPYRFFKNIYEHIVSKKLGVVVLASYNKIFIAGAIFFHFRDIAIYKYGASDLQYKHLRPNNLVMWKAIKWYTNKEYQSLLLGRTELDNYGLRQFKLGMGAEEYIIKYYRYDLKSGSFVNEPEKVSSFQTKILNKLPVFILKYIGMLYYKHAA